MGLVLSLAHCLSAHDRLQHLGEDCAGPHRQGRTNASLWYADVLVSLLRTSAHPGGEQEGGATSDYFTRETERLSITLVIVEAEEAVQCCVRWIHYLPAI